MLAKVPAVLFCIVAVAEGLAQGGPPPIPTELRARFGFDGPLVVKVGDGVGNLQVLDVDGDGKVEAVAVDARRGRLAVVRVKNGAAVLEPVPTNGQIGGYTVADVHGDGKPDLLLVDGRGRLTIRHPGAEPSGPPLDLGLGGRGVSLLAGDLDGDGKQDLVAIARGSMRWITKVGTEPELSPVEPLEENAFSFHLADVDGDRLLDLVAVAPGSNMNLRLRSGQPGGFGPWRIAGIDDLRSVFPARLADGTPALATIAGPTRSVALQQWVAGPDQQSLDWWSFGEAAGTKAPPFVLTDIDGDGDEDLVLARPDRAQLLVHEWRDETFVVRTVPTLAGTASIAAGDVDRDGAQDLVLVSPEEDTVAWRSGKVALEQFPAQLPTVDKPLAAVVLPDGGVLVLGRTEKRDGHLHKLMPGAEPVKVADLGRLPADPQRLLVAELGGGDGLELAFVVPGEGLRTLTLGSDAKKNGKAGETAGFTKKLDDGSVALSGAALGNPVLLAVRERFVRTFRLDAQGQVQVIAQDNGPDGLGELSLCAETDAGALGGTVRFYFDRKANKLVRVIGKKAIAVEVPAFEFTHLMPHRGAALLLGARGVLRVPFQSGKGLRTVTSHEPPQERTFYWDGRSGDFDGDGVQDLLLVDRHLPGLQVVAGGAAGLQRAMAIPVFEAPTSDEPNNEPRELEVGDLDGDGRTDFVLIAHDRILVYLQEP
ncbi:MAG: VCBS repeat-containing protein [Planctomycetes bacterium]|jgi:hypothetical protein|nr:VCBS repeat-containing protein [Planctomycetota bacterium]